jgi:RNA-directed DNA polymerase
MIDLIALAAKECHVPVDWVEQVVRKGASRAAKIQVPKRSGGFRIVFRPSSELEILQRWLLVRFLNNFEIHNIAMAFRKGRSIVTNAHSHRYGKYFIRIDFKDFFPSIKFSDFIAIMNSVEYGKDFLNEYADSHRFIERICFGLDLSLPVGYVTSPFISNFVMYNFDAKLEEMVAVKKMEFGASVVTRYADDIVFSTDKRGGCDAFFQEFSKLLAATKIPNLRINSSKTNYTSRLAGSAIVTGLRVCQDTHITITRKQKDVVRLLLSLYSRRELDTEDIPVLRGHLAYARHAAPAFFSSLCLKYVSVIGELI